MTLKKIIKLINKGKYAEVVKDLEMLIKSQPNSSEAWCLLSQAYNMSKNYEKARDSANRALELQPNLRNAMDQLFFAYDQLEDFKMALAVLKDYLKFLDIESIKFIDMHNYPNGTILFNLNNLNIPILKNISKKDDIYSIPIDITTQIGLYFLFSKIINSDKVAELFQILLDKFPHDKILRKHLGSALYDRGDYDEIILLMDESLKMWPSEPLFLEILGLAYFKKNELDLSIEIFLDAIKNVINPVNIKNEHLKKLSKWEINQKLSPLYYYLATVYYSNKNYTEALNFCIKRLEITPSSEKVLDLKKKIMEKLNQ